MSSPSSEPPPCVALASPQALFSVRVPSRQSSRSSHFRPNGLNVYHLNFVLDCFYRVLSHLDWILLEFFQSQIEKVLIIQLAQLIGIQVGKLRPRRDIGFALGSSLIEWREH